jgi:hypothetical protein
LVALSPHATLSAGLPLGIQAGSCDQVHGTLSQAEEELDGMSDRSHSISWFLLYAGVMGVVHAADMYVHMRPVPTPLGLAG